MPRLNADAENAPLLPSTANGDRSYKSQHNNNSIFAKVTAYLSQDVKQDWADTILIVSFFVAGLIDSGAYNAYECFVSMQTGNTVFAALGVSDLPVSQPALAWTKSVTSIVCFLAGSFIIGSVQHNHFGQRKRWVLAGSFTVQMLMTAVAAVLVGEGWTTGSPVSPPPAASAATVVEANGLLPSDPGFPWIDLLPIGMLSFQASGKVVASRALQYNALPCVVLTTLFSDLMSDPGLFTAGIMGNVARNRRIAGFVFYFGGAVSGGAAVKSFMGFAGALWIACGVKAAIVIAWLLWKADEEEDRES